MPDKKENQKEILETLKVTISLAKIGEHFVNFIVNCRKINASPLAVVKVFREARAEEPEKVSEHKELIPTLCFIDWLEDPSEDNFQLLQKSLGVKIDMIVKKELEEQSSQPEENK